MSFNNIKITKWVITLAFTILILSQCFNTSWGTPNQKKASIVGVWQGILDTGMGAKLHLVVTISQDDQGKLGGDLVSTDQSPSSIPLSDIIYENNTLSFKSNAITASYQGKVNEAISSIDGVFTQNGMNFTVIFKKVNKGYLDKVTQGSIVGKKDSHDIVGIWEGKIALQAGMSLRLIFHFNIDKTNILSGFIDSPDQGAYNIPAKPTYHNGSLNVNVVSVGGSYTAALSKDKLSLEGKWSQMGNSIPLKLTKTKHVTVLNRPQTPKPPFPYLSKDIIFNNEKAKIRLAGTLTIPEGKGPFPAVVMVCGSGPHDRDETIFEHKPFLVIADTLTRNGVAVLRYDKRGIGKSKGNYEKAALEDFVSDAASAVQYLKTTPEINFKKIGMIGHSEGGMVLPICASRSNDVAFIVLMAGPGQPCDQLLLWQQGAIGKAMGEPQAQLNATRELTSQLIATLNKSNDPKLTDKNMRECIKSYIKIHKEFAKPLEDANSVNASIKMMNSDWFRSFINYNPEPALLKVHCPVLAINGSLDLQVDPNKDLKGIEKALKENGNPDYTIQELQGLNHLFQPAKIGTPAEYNTIETTIDPKALSLINEWIVKHTKE